MSYLELLTALFVFSVGVMAAFQMFNFGLDKTRVIKEGDIAQRAVQNEIETLRTLAFDDLQAGAHPFVSDTPEVDQLVNAVPTVQIEPFDPGLRGLMRVKVSLAWTGDNGRTISRSVETLIGEKGVQQ